MREFARLWLTQIAWLAVFSICLSSAALQATGLFDVTMHLSTNAANLVTRTTAALGLATELEREFHTTLTQWFTVSLIAAGFILPFVPTYGKHAGGSTSLIARCFGPGIPPRVLLPRALAWAVQEAPAFLVHAVLFLEALPMLNFAQRLLSGLFLMHYWHRSFIYPLRMRGGKPMPTLLFLSAATFCLLNGYIQGRAITHFSAHLQQPEWAAQPQFLLGVFIFLAGRCINLHSDEVLRNLRLPGEKGYKIPYGGAFGWISAANLWGEMVEWIGFAIACGNAAGLAFAVSTVANLVPRAISTHSWYNNKFKEEYSQLNRRALVPFVF